MVECFSLGVAAPLKPAFFDVEMPPLDHGDVLVRTLYSGLSAGTELTYVKGTDPAFTFMRDPELGVFVAGTAGRRFPVVTMGYMEVGEVVDSRRDDLPAGTLVAAAYGHRSCHVLTPGAHVVPVPAEVDPVLGIYLAQTGPVSGLKRPPSSTPHPDPELGDGVRDRHVVVTGAGVVGLLTALLAHRHGARSVVAPTPTPTGWRSPRTLASTSSTSPPRSCGGGARTPGRMAPPTVVPTWSSSAVAAMRSRTRRCDHCGPRAW